MTARFNNHSSKEQLLAKVFKAMTYSTRRLWFVRASIPFFTLLYVWLGIVNLVSAEGLEGNKVVDMSSLSCGELLRFPCRKLSSRSAGSEVSTLVSRTIRK